MSSQAEKRRKDEIILIRKSAKQNEPENVFLNNFTQDVKPSHERLEEKIDTLIVRLKANLSEEVGNQAERMLNSYLDRPLLVEGMVSAISRSLTRLGNSVFSDELINNLKETSSILSEEKTVAKTKKIFDEVSKTASRDIITKINAENMVLYALSPDMPLDTAKRDKGVVYATSSEKALERFFSVLRNEYKNIDMLYGYLEEKLGRESKRSGIVVDHTILEGAGDFGYYSDVMNISYVDVHLNKKRRLPTSAHELYHPQQDYSFRQRSEESQKWGAIVAVIEGGSEFFEASFMSDIVSKNGSDKSVFKYLRKEMSGYFRDMQPKAVIEGLYRTISSAKSVEALIDKIDEEVQAKYYQGLGNYQYATGIALTAILFAHNGFGEKGKRQTVLDMTMPYDKVIEKVFKMVHENKSGAKIIDLLGKF